MTDFTQIPGVRLSMRNQVSVIEIDNAFATAKLSPHGANVFSYCPKNADGSAGADLLWLSEQAVFDGKTAIRGGVPICWPWFSGYSAQYNAPVVEGSNPPAHGLVRRAAWHLEDIQALENGATKVLFSYRSNAETLAIWPYEFVLHFQVVVGETLSLSLITHNLTDLDLPMTEALHTYFNLPGDGSLQIDGLQGAMEINTLNQQNSLVAESVTLAGPIDNVYLQASNRLLAKVHGEVKLQIDTAHAASAVLWNPGPETVKNFADVDHAKWAEFVCIENGNVRSDQVTVPARGIHRLQVVISRP
ncbi:MAG: D-hexose-6-phosphate mutarotase [Thiotrichales bacterium]|nr:D-hexose-6-phosphate mutarotase [Thiotrichales bacterium]